MSSPLDRIVPYITSPSRGFRYASARWNEAAWRRTPAHRPKVPLTWGNDTSLRNSVVIGWPRLGAYPAKFIAPIEQAFRRNFRVEEIPFSPNDRTFARFEVRFEGRVFPAIIDYRDNADLLDDFVQKSVVYFKMQFREDGYADRKVIPGGYVPGLDLIIPALNDLRSRRDADHESFDVYGRFGLHSAADIRARAVRMLSGQPDFKYEGGLNIVRFGQYVVELTQARVCLDLPGRGEFCYRLVDYMAVGSAIVAVRHRNRLPVMPQDGRDIAYVDADLSNLLEVVRHYLARPQERRNLVANSREFFDKYLHPEQLIHYYVSSVLQGSSRAPPEQYQPWIPHGDV
ncbi:MAG: glycosyltransferase [Gemmatimonadaceae bacterium]